MQTALGAVLRDASAKELPCGVFGSFGWSGEAVDELESRLRVSARARALLCNVSLCCYDTWVHGCCVTP